MLSLPLSADSTQTTAQIQANLHHIRNVLAIIQGDYESLSGCILALGATALHVISPQDNIEDVAEDMGAILYEVYQGLGLKRVSLISGQEVLVTLSC